MNYDIKKIIEIYEFSKNKNGAKNPCYKTSTVQDELFKKETKQSND